MDYIRLYAYQRHYHRTARTNKNRKNEMKVIFPIIELSTKFIKNTLHTFL